MKRCIRAFKTLTRCLHYLKSDLSKDDELGGLKLYDWHKFYHFILPTAIQGCLIENLRVTVYKISALVQWISTKEIFKDSYNNTSKCNRGNLHGGETFSQKCSHHLDALTCPYIDKVAAARTIHSQWMFFLERFMKTLKSFFCQRPYLEGRMAEGWLVQESLVSASS